MKVPEGVIVRESTLADREKDLSRIQKIFQESMMGIIGDAQIAQQWFQSQSPHLGYCNVVDAHTRYCYEKGKTLLIAEREGNVVGYLGAMPGQNYPDVMVQLFIIACDPRFQRTGIGSLLCRNLFDRHQGKFFEVCSIDRPEQIAFYESLGFRKTDHTERVVGDMCIRYMSR